MKEKIYTTLLAVFISIISIAQAPLAKLLELAKLGEEQLGRKHYDSAIISFSKGEKLIGKYNLHHEITCSFIYNETGLTFGEKGNILKAHEYLMRALQNARKYNHASEKETALVNLIDLHRSIVQKNLPFKYPVINEKERSVAYFPVSVIKKEGDSLLVTILAGSYDGINMEEKSLDLFTHYDQRDTLQHSDISFISSARIIQVGLNQTTVKTKIGTIQILTGDQAAVYVQTPLSWRNVSIRKLLLNNLFLVNNYKQYPYHYRFYYYYADSLTESESFETFQASVKEVVTLFAADTLTNNQLGDKIENGLFTGYNAVRAMNETKPLHLKLFLNFVNAFPAKYIGNNYRFSETYATWVINNTPLDPKDVKPYLIGFKDNGEIQREIKKLASQIEEGKLAAEWFNEAMQKSILDNIKEAGLLSNLLDQVGIATKISFDKGWNHVLSAQIEKRLYNNQQADSLLNIAAYTFSQSKNTEGLTWVNNTKLQWKKSNKIEVAIQNGHIFPYTITPSSNPRYFATAGMDNLIKIWDNNLGKEIITLTDHTDEVSSIDFSKNGKYMASAGLDSFINVYNAYNYSKLLSYKTEKPERIIKFSNDHQFLVSAGRDSLIKFRSIETGQIIKTLKLHKGTVYGLAFHPIFDNVLFSAGADSMVYKWDTDSKEMTRWYKYKGKALSVKLSNDGKYMSVVSTDSLLTIRSTETHKIILKYKLGVFAQGSSTYYASESFSPDSKYICFPTAKDSFIIVNLNDHYERIYSTNLKTNILADMQFSSDGKSVFARFDLGGPLRVYNFAGWDIRNNTTINYKDIHSFANIVMSVQFTKDDNGLVVLHNEVSKIDLRNGKYESLFNATSFIENKYLLLNNEQLGTYTSTDKKTLFFWDYKKGQNAKEFSLPDGETFAAFELSKNNQYCFLSSTKGLINAWDTKNNQLLFSKKYLTGENSAINKLNYDEHRNRLLAVTADNKILIISATNGSVLDSILIPAPNYTAVTQQYIYITDEMGNLSKYDASTLVLINKRALNKDGHYAYQLLLSPDEKTLYAQSNYTSIDAIQVSNDATLFSLQGHTNQLTMMAISNNGKLLATSGFDSKINLYNAITGAHVVNIYVPKDRNCMISDDEGYYMAPKNTLDAIIFSYNNNAYTFDQFDVQLNRPDIILGKIGRVDSSLVNSYYAAYKKRLDKLGLSENDNSRKIQLPLVRLQDKSEVQPITNQSNYTLSIECSDNNYPLQSLQVLVNNSPVLGNAGLDLSQYNSRELVQKVTIPLARGNNSIKVYCTNIKGIKSLRESFEIISNYKSKKSGQTYFIGIAVANYKDASMNLQYSAKDIRDLAYTFNDLYSDLHIDTFINASATKQNILSIKKKLLLTDVNDRIILAVTGHGLLNKSFDFYYATYDMDFTHPEKNGIKYEDLEGLLNDIPAQKKLLLIDACHSGALDKDELLANKTEILAADSSEQVNGTSPRGVIKLYSTKENSNNSFEVMQNLFADLSGSNGAIVISAAGGMEYALESAQWNNGVFTYCVRKGIAEKKADTDGGNNDGKVSVQELQQYVSKKVSELTRGRQQPTSRRENVDFEWLLRY